MDIIAKVIETLDTLIALKNASQWKAINKPTEANINSDFKDTFKRLFEIIIKIKTKIEPNNILNQTNGTALIVIKSPKTAVKPQIKTIKCKCK